MVGCATTSSAGWPSGPQRPGEDSTGWFPCVFHHAWLKPVDPDASTQQVYAEKSPNVSGGDPQSGARCPPKGIPRAQPRRGDPKAGGLWAAPAPPPHRTTVMLVGGVRASPWPTRDQSR